MKIHETVLSLALAATLSVGNLAVAEAAGVAQTDGSPEREAEEEVPTVPTFDKILAQRPSLAELPNPDDEIARARKLALNFRSGYKKPEYGKSARLDGAKLATYDTLVNSCPFKVEDRYLGLGDAFVPEINKENTRICDCYAFVGLSVLANKAKVDKDSFLLGRENSTLFDNCRAEVVNAAFNKHLEEGSKASNPDFKRLYIEVRTRLFDWAMHRSLENPAFDEWMREKYPEDVKALDAKIAGGMKLDKQCVAWKMANSVPIGALGDSNLAWKKATLQDFPKIYGECLVGK